jgi:predicted nuclease of predicted toxin-antitoxin system
VKLLLDANLSPALRAGLENAGYEALHVGEVDLLQASDKVILDFAATEQLVIVTADSDFASMLALSGASRPSIVHLRGVAELAPATHLRLLLDNLTTVTEELDQGAVVSLSPVRLAVRRLPIV